MEASLNSLIRFGPFEADLHAVALSRDGTRIPLQRQVFELLACLLERPGKLIARDELCARLWPDGTFVDFEHGLNTAVRKLRRALDDSAESPRYVETVVGRGYRFLARVEARAAEPTAVPAQPTSPLLGRPPFVGREAELGTLAARLAEAREGRGRLVLVAGEPGIGKTRLFEEFMNRAHFERALVLVGRCAQVEGSYRPLTEALTGWVRGADEATLRALAEPTWSGVVARVVPLLRDRLGDVPEPAPLRPDEERSRLHDALAQLFAALAKRTPTVLLLDDLHWADPATIAVVLHLAGVTRQSALLIVGSYREDEVDRAHPLTHLVDALGRGGSFEQLSLVGLGAGPVGAWIEAVSPGAAPALVDAVLRATDGNPFFVRELLLAWMQSDARNLGQGVESLSIPSSVREMVAERLAKLAEEAQRLLAAASIFQGVFDFDVARLAASLDEDRSLDALDDAHAAQLVRSAGGPDDYDFVHAMIRHVLYEGLVPARRVRLHRRVAEELARQAEAGGARQPAEIAEHYHRSRELRGAEAGVPHALAAADRAEAAADFESAVRLLRMALDLLPELDVRRPRTLHRLGLALSWAGASEEAARVAGEAGVAIAAQEGPRPAAQALADVADALYLRSYQPLAGTLVEQGLHYAGDRRDQTWLRLAAHRVLSLDALNPELSMLPVDTPLRREVSRSLLAHPGSVPPRIESDLFIFDSREEAIDRGSHMPGVRLCWIGDYRGALPLYREETRLALARGQLALAADRLAATNHAEIALGNLAAADESAARVAELLQRTEPLAFMAVRLHIMALLRAKVRGEGIREALAGVRQSSRAVGLRDSFLAGTMYAMGGAFAALLGRTEDALRLLDLALPIVEKGPGWAVHQTWVIANAVEILWTSGAQRHLETLERCLRERTLKPDFRFPDTDARLSMARLCALSGRCDAASDWFAKARVVLDEQGARPLRAIADFDEAWMYLRRGRRGDRTRALPLLDAAVEQFETIGMPGWVRRAEELARG